MTFIHWICTCTTFCIMHNGIIVALLSLRHILFSIEFCAEYNEMQVKIFYEMKRYQHEDFFPLHKYVRNDFGIFERKSDWIFGVNSLCRTVLTNFFRIH